MSEIKALEIQIKTAREYGAMYHPTNPKDAWFCKACCVFGRGETECWACGGEVEVQWIPRFGGGTQSHILQDTNPCAEISAVSNFTPLPAQEWYLGGGELHG